MRSYDPIVTASSHLASMSHGFCFPNNSGYTFPLFSQPFLRWGRHPLSLGLPSSSPNWCSHQSIPHTIHCHSIHPKEQVEVFVIPCSNALSSSPRPTTLFDLPSSPLQQRVSNIGLSKLMLQYCPLHIFLWRPNFHPLRLRIQITFLSYFCLSERYSHLFQCYFLHRDFSDSRPTYPFQQTHTRYNLPFLWTHITLCTFWRCYPLPSMRASCELGLNINTLVSHANVYSYNA